jgi:hypothetical protein
MVADELQIFFIIPIVYRFFVKHRGSGITSNTKLNRRGSQQLLAAGSYRPKFIWEIPSNFLQWTMFVYHTLKLPNPALFFRLRNGLFSLKKQSICQFNPHENEERFNLSMERRA